MSPGALQTVVESKIWAMDRPVWFSGVRLRARTTVVRLENGDLLLHSPAPPTATLANELRALGPVRWLVVPNRFHHLGTPQAAAAFPEAHVVGPRSALDRNQALKVHIDIQNVRFGEQVGEFEMLPLLGVPFLDETVLYHRPTQTLLGADVALGADVKDHWTWRWAARITGCYERLRVPPDVRKKIQDKSAAGHSLQVMLARPARRLIVAHAEIVEQDWRDRLAEAWRLEGVSV